MTNKTTGEKATTSCKEISVDAITATVLVEVDDIFFILKDKQGTSQKAFLGGHVLILLTLAALSS